MSILNNVVELLSNQTNDDSASQITYVLEPVSRKLYILTLICSLFKVSKLLESTFASSDFLRK